MRGQHWIERLSDGLDLTGEVNADSLVELAGDRRVLIEHHRGICRYQKDCICVLVSFGKVRIEGCGLEIAKMNRDQLVICGKIRTVTLDRRDD